MISIQSLFEGNLEGQMLDLTNQNQYFAFWFAEQTGSTVLNKVKNKNYQFNMSIVKTIAMSVKYN